MFCHLRCARRRLFSPPAVKHLDVRFKIIWWILSKRGPHFSKLGNSPPPKLKNLLTDDGLEDRWRYVNAMNTLDALFRFRAVPIVNENDSVAVEENKVGDNDRLAALVSHLVEADLLVTYTTVDGLFSDDPTRSDTATHIPMVSEVTPEMIERAGAAGSAVSLGGMRTKLEAARSVGRAGVPMVIADGRTASLVEILKGEEVGTLFLPTHDKMQGRKRWIANTRRKGAVIVDDGAVRL